ncbi:MAG: M20 family metallopeptidase [Clostridia bacterium]|nr:M20 family metallopeptidase [Clostridia bacterium]
MDYKKIECIFDECFSANELINIRREIHMHPELGCQEFNTGDIICRCLDQWNIPYTRGVADTGIVAKMHGTRPGKTIAIRADIDALPIQEENDIPFKSLIPGKMHACGHDIHTTVLLGLARLLKQLNGDYAGSFTLIFQPAEESIGGAERMIEAGVLEEPYADHVIALHCGADIEAGKVGLKYGSMFAGSDAFNVVVKGKSSHAAYPSLGLDPIVMTAQAISAVQSIVSRSTAPQNSAVVTIGKINGGTVRNQIPDCVELQGTIRTLDPETREYTVKKAESIFRGVVEGMGGTLEFTRIPSYPPLINDDSVVEKVKQVFCSAIGPDSVLLLKDPVMGCEDFAYFTAERPSMIWRLGCKTPDTEIVPLHNSKFNPDERCISLGVKLQTLAALTLAGN